MTLAAITRGKVPKPHRVVIYGADGVGKSTFAASAPNAIFLGAEKGTGQLDVARLPQPREWSDVGDAMKLLAMEPHDYKTLAVDSLDWLEPVLHTMIVKKEQVASIDDIAYGRGFNVALDYWRNFLEQLEYVADRRGMNVVLIAHSQLRTFKNPEGPDFDRYELKLHHKAGGLFREWADSVLFAAYETFAVEKKGRVRGVDSGARVVYTTRTAAYDAKNRYSLPSKLPLSWDDFEAACKTEQPASPDALRAGIEALLDGADPELVTKVRATLEAAGNNTTKLGQIHNRLMTITNNNDKKDTAQ